MFEIWHVNGFPKQKCTHLILSRSFSKHKHYVVIRLNINCSQAVVENELQEAFTRIFVGAFELKLSSCDIGGACQLPG